MSKTRRELVDQALRVLGVLPAGASPSDDDVTSVDDYVDPLLSELAELEIFYVADDDEIPDEAFLSLGILLANSCKEEFGVPPFDIAEAERKLRKLSAAKTLNQTLQVDYF